MKLWAACDTIELLLKFLVIIGAADRRQHGELDDKLLKELWGKIEMPTLGAGLSMAVSLSQSKSKNDLMIPEIDQYVNATLKTLLYGRFAFFYNMAESFDSDTFDFGIREEYLFINY